MITRTYNKETRLQLTCFPVYVFTYFPVYKHSHPIPNTCDDLRGKSVLTSTRVSSLFHQQSV